MAATWLVTLKAALPYIESILAVVAPVFTKKKVDSLSSQTDLLQKQIDELQQAAAQNAHNIKDAAEQLKRIVVALDQAALSLEAANRRHWTLCIIALVMSAGALVGVAAVALTR